MTARDPQQDLFTLLEGAVADAVFPGCVALVWRDGAKAGLRAEDRVPIEEIVTLGQSRVLQLTAGSGPAERRRYPRAEDRHRLRARAFEFASVVAIGAWLAGGAVMLVEEAFARPLAILQAALGG